MGEMGFDYSGCHIVVTGGTQGDGLRIARGFHDFGAAVTVTGRQYLTSYYDADLARFNYAQLDLADPDSIASVVESLGPVDVLVNSAGTGLAATRETDREFIVQATSLGLIGPLQLTTRLRYRLAESRIHGGGSVIHAPACQQWFAMTHPDTAQSELIAVTARMGSTWFRHGVRVNSITAPIVEPSRTRGLQVQIAANSGPLLTRSSLSANRGHPDLASLALFLASRGAAALAGQTLMAR